MVCDGVTAGRGEVGEHDEPVDARQHVKTRIRRYVQQHRPDISHRAPSLAQRPSNITAWAVSPARGVCRCGPWRYSSVGLDGRFWTFLFPEIEMVQNRPSTPTLVVRSVVCVSACLLSCVKTAELTRTTFGGQNRLDSRNHVTDGGPDARREGKLLGETRAVQLLSLIHI